MEFEIKPANKINLGINELWKHKELLYFFVWRDIKVKYKQTALGFIWVVLQPFIMMVIFSVFFGVALKVPSDNVDYPIFVFSGLLLWNIFSSGISTAGNSMVTNSNIIKKIYFPRLIIPISAVLVSLFDFFMAFVIFIAMMFYYHTPINLGKMFLCFPAGLIITSFATFGLGTLLSALNLKYRDFRYIIPFLVQAMLFITPVIYPVSIITHNWIKYFLAINPMYSAIEIFRNCIIQKPLEVNLILTSLASCIFLFIAGLYYFRKTESYFADIV